MLQHHDELIAAQSGCGVDRAERRLDPARRLLEYFIARLVPQPIVDLLEAVEVEEHERYAPVRPLRS